MDYCLPYLQCKDRTTLNGSCRNSQILQKIFIIKLN